MKKRFWVCGICALALGAGLAAAASYTAIAQPRASEPALIPEGVYVGEQSLGGMTEEEANQEITDYVNGMSAQKITLNVDGQPVETSAEELGFHWSNPEAAQESIQKYTKGNLVVRYLAARDLKKEKVRIPLETSVDDGKVEAFVNEKCASLMTPPQDAAIARENGQFVITPGTAGKVVDLEATKKALNEALAAGLDQPVEADAVVAESQPAVTAEALGTIQDVLGTFTTSFSSSGASRSKNLNVGAGKINGHVLLPGQTLSGYECMQPFTTANGYATAAAYENGQVVDSVGGGVCQIATTLYNAALRAELEITQRQNHSMVVGYVDHSADAAIAGTYKDIKITNNYGTPIYVEGYTAGKKLTFTIYGKETRPANRQVQYVSETLSVTSPGDPITKEDPSLPPGKRVTEQSGHKGVRSRLWKVVTVDGVETERTLLHTDTYNAAKAIVRVGPEAPVAAPVPETPPAATAPPETAAPQPVEGVDGGPGVTQPAPQTEPALQTEPAPPSPEGAGTEPAAG